MNKTNQTILAVCLVVIAMMAWGFIYLSQPEKSKARTGQINDDPLFKAIHEDNYTDVEKIVKADPNILTKMHATGGTYMNCAAASKNTKMMKLLLKLGGNPNGVAGCGMSPLILACSSKDLQMIEILLKAGADPNVFGHGMSPLTTARQANDKAMEKLLLKYNAKEITMESYAKQYKKQKKNN